LVNQQHNTNNNIAETKMSAKCSKIRHIVRLRQMLRRWRNKARMSSANRAPSDVPSGHVAVCVGANYTRFVVRATYLNHPIFQKLLVQAEEEYGFSNHGPLTIPCDEDFFEEALRFISRSGSNNGPNRFVNLEVEDIHKRCHVGIRNNVDFWPESRPLLHGLSEKTIW
jgi:SAUR family protein